MAIKSSKFSFVRFNSDWQTCREEDYALPAGAGTLPAFQFQPVENVAAATSFSASLLQTDCNTVIATAVASATRLSYKLSAPVEGPVTLTTITYGDITKEYNSESVTIEELIQILSGDFGINAFYDADGNLYFFSVCDLALTINAIAFTLYYGSGYIDLSGVAFPGGIAEGDCFRIGVFAGETNEGCSNTFYKSSGVCKQSFIEYSCNEDGFAFIYTGGQINKILLPCYLLRPTWQKKREMYRFSNGKNKLLSSVVDKSYQIVTEYMPEVFHECMAIMLAHDNIIIQNEDVREGTVEVIETDDYNTEWQESEGDYNAFPHAKGIGRVKVAKYSYANSNCETLGDPCDQDTPPPVECIAVAITGNVALPDAIAGTPYDQVLATITAGSGAITLTDVSKPSWMTVAIVDGEVKATGTPAEADEATDITVSFVINGCDESFEEYTSETFDVIVEEGAITIDSSGFGMTIDDVTGIPGFTFDTGDPVAAGEEQEGTHGPFAGGDVIVDLSGTATLPGSFPYNLTFSINGVPVACETVNSAGTFTLEDVPAYATYDDISVSLNMGACP